MITFIQEGNILAIENEKIILPITVKPGLQPYGTEKVIEYFPSLRGVIETYQGEALSVGTLIRNAMPNMSDCEISLLVTDFRARPGANINYMTQALSALSAHIRGFDARYVVAPLASESEVPCDLIQKLVEGIMRDSEADIGFYLK